MADIRPLPEALSHRNLRRTKKLPIGSRPLPRSVARVAIPSIKRATPSSSQTRAATTFSPVPRRFGKSLFLDALKELFEANRPRFEGLYAADQWDWSTPHPVIRISFADGVGKQPDGLLRRIVNPAGFNLQIPRCNRMICTMSALEQSGIITLLEPWFSNATKSLVKTPKLLTRPDDSVEAGKE